MSSGRIATLEAATRYLDGLVNRERATDYAYARLDLRPIEALVEAIGRPHDRLSIVHVAGSKGKGSTCLLVEALLGALGERVGTFTSPHLVHWLERFRIAGREVDADRLVAAVEGVRPAVDRLREGPLETRPSFFDATTAVALALFAEARVDRAVLEVGLGGRLDSTNVVRPRVTCVTSIELEHVDKLGSTEAAIAGEKAGILKQGVPAVLGALGADAARVIGARAEAVGAPVFARGRFFEVRSLVGTLEGVGAGASGSADESAQRIVFESEGWAPIESPLASPGEAAAGNAGLAIACVRALGVYSEAAIREAVPRAFGQVVLPGRIEILPNDPVVVIDAAHTERSAQVLARALERLAPAGCVLLVSISSDKNVAAVLEALLPSARRVVVTRAEPVRSLDPVQLAALIRSRRPELAVEIVEDPREASHLARAAVSGAGERLCAVGSVYLAGIARSELTARQARSGGVGSKTEAPELAPRTYVRREG